MVSSHPAHKTAPIRPAGGAAAATHPMYQGDSPLLLPQFRSGLGRAWGGRGQGCSSSLLAPCLHARLLPPWAQAWQSCLPHPRLPGEKEQAENSLGCTTSSKGRAPRTPRLRSESPPADEPWDKGPSCSLTCSEPSRCHLQASGPCLAVPKGIRAYVCVLGAGGPSTPEPHQCH